MTTRGWIAAAIGLVGLGTAAVATGAGGPTGGMSATACESAQREGEPCPGWSPDQLLDLRCHIAEKELPEWAAILPDGANDLLQLAMEKRVDVILRPVTAIAPSLRGLGHPGKPESVKWKSCTVEDQYIGAPVGCFGLVLLFEPTPPPTSAEIPSFDTKRVAEIKALAVAAEKAQRNVEAANLRELAKRLDLANTQWDTVNARYKDRLKEWQDFVEDTKALRAAKGQDPAAPLTIADYNATLDKIFDDYVEHKGEAGFADLGRPRLAPDPLYASPAQYQAAIQKPGVVARYVVDLRASGTVGAYTGDLDLFDFHRQPLPPSEAELWPKLNPGEKATQPTPGEGDGDWPRRLYLLGVDVYHGPILFWTGWYDGTSPEKTARYERVFDGVMDGHLPPEDPTMAGGPRTKKPGYVIRVTPTCNLCEAWSPTRDELLAWKEGVRAADAPGGAAGPRAGMDYRYSCAGRTLFPASAPPSEQVSEPTAPATPEAPVEEAAEQAAEKEEEAHECTLDGECSSPKDCCMPTAICVPNDASDPVKRCRIPLGSVCQADGSLGACDVRTGGFCSDKGVCSDETGDDDKKGKKSEKDEAIDALKGKAGGVFH